MIRTILFLLFVIPAAAQHPCAECHGPVFEVIKANPHPSKTLDCVSCHEDSETHISAKGASPPDKIAAPHEVSALCGKCHSFEEKEYKASKHGKLVLALAEQKAPQCGSCHGHHGVKPMAEVEKECGSCHAKLPDACKQKPAATAKTACTGCHAKHTFVAKK